ncbi:MAG: DUF2225 domain-containing protein [Lachnospiraceae bacterium]|nr:DUF2225 domain-containing protein [Lachnospiraceae bacterium]
MSLFSGLEKMGLGKMKNVVLYAEEDKEEVKKAETAKKEVTVNETDFIYDKSFPCPVCNKTLKTKVVKTGKARLTGQDIDLRPKYNDIDVLKYDVIACPICGYASLPRTFDKLTSPQAKLIKENISVSFTGLKTEGMETYTYDDAIARARLALINTVVKKGKLGERAYMCLELAWLLRGKRENLPEDTSDRNKVITELMADENEMLENARDGFTSAFSKEGFPLYSLDETTATYVVAALCAETGDKENALRWTSKLIASTAANERIKERARTLKEKVISGEKLL